MNRVSVESHPRDCSDKSCLQELRPSYIDVVSKVNRVHCTLYTVHCTPVHSTPVHTVHCTLYTVNLTPYR